MQESTTREKVLKKIRSALITPTSNPYPNMDFECPVFRMNDDEPELLFARAFRDAGGQFVFCENMIEFAEALLNIAQNKGWSKLICTDEKLGAFLEQCEFPINRNPDDFEQSHIAITGCECLVARTGSILISSAMSSGRVLPAFSEVHIVVANPDQFVDDIKDAFNLLKAKYPGGFPSSSTFITGPSCTADIGNELITGAQGPKELFLFLVDKNS